MRYVVLSLLMMFGLTPTAYGQINQICLFYNLGSVGGGMNLYYAFRYAGLTCNDFEFVTIESDGSTFPGYCELPANCNSCIVLGPARTAAAADPVLSNPFGLDPSAVKLRNIVEKLRDDDQANGLTTIGTARIYSVPDTNGGFKYVALLRREVPLAIGLGKIAYRDVVVGFEFTPDSTEISKAVPFQGKIKKVSVERSDGTRFVGNCLNFDFVTGSAVVYVKDVNAGWPIDR